MNCPAKVAAVPYAKVGGTLRARAAASRRGAAVDYDNQSGYGLDGPTEAFNIHGVQSSPTSMDGWGYGAMGEAMVGFHPTEQYSAPGRRASLVPAEGARMRRSDALR